MPMLDIPLDRVVPSTLHSFMGVTTKLFKNLENLAKKSDPSIYSAIQDVLAKSL